MAVDLLWVQDNLDELLKQGKITLSEYERFCISLADEEEERE